MKTKLFLIAFGFILTSHAYSFSLEQDDSLLIQKNDYLATDHSFKTIKNDLLMVNFEIIDEPFLGEKMIMKRIVDPRKTSSRELTLLYSW